MKIHAKPRFGYMKTPQRKDTDLKHGEGHAMIWSRLKKKNRNAAERIVFYSASITINTKAKALNLK
jgi:hypothetical protein